jgi:hypothetical protein
MYIHVQYNIPVYIADFGADEDLHEQTPRARTVYYTGGIEPTAINLLIKHRPMTYRRIYDKRKRGRENTISRDIIYT